MSVLDFSLTDVTGDPGSMLRAELYNPTNGTTAGALIVGMALTGVGEKFSGTVSAGTLQDSLLGYEYEVRSVTAQTHAAFVASDNIIIERGFYNYVVGGQWTTVQPTVLGDGYWTSRTAVERRFGVFNCAADADLENDGAGVDAVWSDVLAEVDATWNREISAYGSPDLSADDAVLRLLARDWCRVLLYYGRGWGDVGNPQDVAGKYSKLRDDTWARFIKILELRAPGVTSGILGSPYDFAFVEVDRGTVDAVDEFSA